MGANGAQRSWRPVDYLVRFAVINSYGAGFSKHITAAEFTLLGVVYSETYTIFQPSYFWSLEFVVLSFPVLNSTHRVIIDDPSDPDSLTCELIFAAAQPVSSTTMPKVTTCFIFNSPRSKNDPSGCERIANLTPCSMRAHEMEPKAQCNGRRRACDC